VEVELAGDGDLLSSAGGEWLRSSSGKSMSIRTISTSGISETGCLSLRNSPFIGGTWGEVRMAGGAVVCVLADGELCPRCKSSGKPGGWLL